MSATGSFGPHRYGGAAGRWTMCSRDLPDLDVDQVTSTGTTRVLLNAQQCERAPVALLAFLIVTGLLSLLSLFTQVAIIPGTTPASFTARLGAGFKRYTVVASTLCFVVVQILDAITLTSFMSWSLQPSTFFYYPIFSELLWRLTELGYAIYTTQKYSLYLSSLPLKRSITRALSDVAWALTVFMAALTAASWVFLVVFYVQIAHRSAAAGRGLTYYEARRLAVAEEYEKAKHLGNGYEAVMVVWSLAMLGSVGYVWVSRRERRGLKTEAEGAAREDDAAARGVERGIVRGRWALLVVSALFCAKGLEQIVGTHVHPLEYHHWGPAYVTDTVVSVLWRGLVVLIGVSLYLLPVERVPGVVQGRKRSTAT